jgi:hypothetical protein
MRFAMGAENQWWDYGAWRHDVKWLMCSLRTYKAL